MQQQSTDTRPLAPGQPAVLGPRHDETTIELTEDDINNIPNVFKFLALCKEYHNSPPPPPDGRRTPGLRYNSGNPVGDVYNGEWADLTKLYGEVRGYIKRLILYYGRHVEPVADPVESYAGMPTFYQGIGDRLFYRGADFFISSSNVARNYVIKALDWYYLNDPSRGTIIEILDKEIHLLKGRDFLLLMTENRRQADYEKKKEAI